MNATRLKLVIATVALAFSGAVFAGAPWTYVDLGYITADSGDDRTDGLSLRGSFGFADIWHAGVALQGIEVAGGKSKPAGGDVSGGNIYIGLHPAVTANTDLVVDLGYEGLEVEEEFTSGTQKNDITSLFLRAGPRALLAGEKLELSAYMVLATGEEEVSGSGAKRDFTNVGLQVGGQYYFSPAWSVGADAQINRFDAASGSSGGDFLNVFVRWSFGS